MAAALIAAPLIGRLATSVVTAVLIYFSRDFSNTALIRVVTCCAPKNKKTMDEIGFFTVESGFLETAFDLFVPATPPAVGGVLLLHGFGVDRRSLRGHAERLARKGRLVLCPDMSSLLWGGMEAAQTRNVRQAVAAGRWLFARPDLAVSTARKPTHPSSSSLNA